MPQICSAVLGGRQRYQHRRELKTKKTPNVGHADDCMEAVFQCVHSPLEQLVPKANIRGSLSRTVCSHTYLRSLWSQPLSRLAPSARVSEATLPTRDTPPSTAPLCDPSDPPASFSGVNLLRCSLPYSYSPDSVLPAVTALWRLRRVTALNSRTASLTACPGHLFAAKAPPNATAPRLSRSHSLKFPGHF